MSRRTILCLGSARPASRFFLYCFVQSVNELVPLFSRQRQQLWPSDRYPARVHRLATPQCSLFDTSRPSMVLVLSLWELSAVLFCSLSDSIKTTGEPIDPLFSIYFLDLIAISYSSKISSCPTTGKNQHLCQLTAFLPVRFAIGKGTETSR